MMYTANVAVYTSLSDRTLREYLRPFQLGALISAEGVSAGTINTIYDIRTRKGRFILRILENRTLTDARFEEALLSHLAVRRLCVPTMVPAAGHGHIMSIGPKQQLSVFEYLPGREVAVFEVTPTHAMAVGRFLGRLHVATRDFVKRRQHRFDPPRMLRLAQRCEKGLRNKEVAADLAAVHRELVRHHWEVTLPRGVIHGDLFIDNVRFSRQRLVGVLDFEMASTGPLAYDIAVAIVDWGFVCNRLVPEHAAAIVAGYLTERRLSPRERDALYDLCCFAAARFTLTRIHDFEVRTRPQAQRLYKDYRHFLTRLEALQQLGARGFATAIFGQFQDGQRRRS